MIDTISKILLILKKKAITNIYYIISLYIFIIYYIELASLEKKRLEITQKIAIIK